MPSTTLQSRINAFEALSASTESSSTITNSFDLLEAPLSPPGTGSSSFLPIQPQRAGQSRLNGSNNPGASPSSQASSGPQNTGTRASPDDLGDWVLDDGASSSSGSFPKSNIHSVNKTFNSSAPLISFGSPPRAGTRKGPALPPRKQTSYNSLKSVSSSASSSSPGNPPPPLPRRVDSLTVSDASEPRNLPIQQRSSSNSLSLPSHPHRTSPSGAIASAGTMGKGHTSASSVSSFHSVSLSSDGRITPDASATSFPPTTAPGSLPPSSSSKHIPDQPSGGSFGSFGDESFENVSIQKEDWGNSENASPASSIGYDWETISTPRLPQRPPPATKPKPYALYRSPSSPSHQTPSVVAPTYNIPRRPPPAVPPKRIVSASSPTSPTSVSSNGLSPRPSLSSLRSDRSSASVSTMSGSTLSPQPSSKPVYPVKAAVLRPPPIPQAAKERYEPIFRANILQYQKARQESDNSSMKQDEKNSLKVPPPRKGRNAGWRGLSVDLITGDDLLVSTPEGQSSSASGSAESPRGITASDTERLDGRAVRMIWAKSKLDRTILASIWSDCDPSSRGSLDCESFVRGMWRIDEELRKRAQPSHPQPNPHRNAHPHAKTHAQAAQRPSTHADFTRSAAPPSAKSYPPPSQYYSNRSTSGSSPSYPPSGQYSASRSPNPNSMAVTKQNQISGGGSGRFTAPLPSQAGFLKAGFNQIVSGQTNAWTK